MVNINKSITDNITSLFRLSRYSKINQKNHETPKRSKMCSVNEKNIQISID